MIPNPFAQSPTPAVRRPIFDIGFGDAASWQDHLVALEICLGMAPRVDVAKLTYGLGAQQESSLPISVPSLGLSDQGGPPTVALDDEGTLALGYEDSEAKVVMSGRVASLSSSLEGRNRVMISGPAAALARLRVVESFAQQSAGDLVKDLAGRAGVATGTVEDGVDLAFMALDDRAHCLDHIAKLSKMSGFLAFFDAEGALHFAPPSEGSPVRTFVYGEDILRLQAHQHQTVTSGVAVVGDGAAGGQGKDAWCWLVKDPAGVRGEAGSEPRQFSEGALRAGEAATSAALGRLTSLGRADSGATVLVPGAEEVLPGTTVAIEGAPEESQNGTYLVWQVNHRYDKHRGFTSRLTLMVAGGGGSGLLDLVGGLL